jgi:threonine/homoserine efflux transporter RhtA
MAPTAFRIFLVLVVLYALFRGSRDERHVALICLIGAVATTLVLSPLAFRFSGVETPVALVDVAVFGGFLVVALRSERFWPLWVAGLQLTTILGHALKGIDSSLLPRAYAASLNFWAYPIVLILAIGTWRAHHRRKRTQIAKPAL